MCCDMPTAHCCASHRQAEQSMASGADLEYACSTTAYRVKAIGDQGLRLDLAWSACQFTLSSWRG